MTIVLGTSQALEGVATNATTVTYTISGLLLSSASPPVATGYEILAQGQLPSSAGSLYNPGGSATALISYISLFNTGASAQTVTIYAEGTTTAHSVAAFSIPASGWAQYEGKNGWIVYTSNGIATAVAPLVSVSAYITATVSITTSITTVSSLVLGPGTWWIYGSLMAHLTTATLGHCDAWLGPTRAATTSAYCAASFSMGDIAGGTEEGDASLFTLQTLTVPTAVYLIAKASETTTAEYISTEESIPNCTGILAIKIG